MKFFNETAAGEFASHQARIKSKMIDEAKAKALAAMREARFSDYESAKAEYYDFGGKEDLESYVCNIVSDEIESGKIAL